MSATAGAVRPGRTATSSSGGGGGPATGPGSAGGSGPIRIVRSPVWPSDVRTVIRRRLAAVTLAPAGTSALNVKPDCATWRKCGKFRATSGRFRP